MAVVVIGVDPHKGSHAAVAFEVSSGHRLWYAKALIFDQQRKVASAWASSSGASSAWWCPE